VVDVMMPDEMELVQKAQTGDALAFEYLVRQYDQQVLSIALSFTNHAEDAKDIYQEVFIRVFRALPGFRFESKFSTWLHKITTNVCLTQRLKAKRHRHQSLDQEFEHADGTSFTLSEVLADDTATPEKESQDSEITQQIQKALEVLSPQQKLVFTLKHYQGYKLREIAEMMNCAEGTVKKHLFVANEKLRDQLKDLL
jgi:RNA polymerase sigma-70 factor (ECF subfamily)